MSNEYDSGLSDNELNEMLIHIAYLKKHFNEQDQVDMIKLVTERTGQKKESESK